MPKEIRLSWDDFNKGRTKVQDYYMSNYTTNYNYYNNNYY